MPSRKDRKAINYFDQYGYRDGYSGAALDRRNREVRDAAERAQRNAKNQGRDTRVFVPGSGPSTIEIIDARAGKGRSLTFDEWAQRRDKMRRRDNHTAGRVNDKPSVASVKLSESDRPMTPDVALREADRRSRNDERRGKVASAYRRLFGEDYKFATKPGEALSEADRLAIGKKLGDFSMSDAEKEAARLQRNRGDYDSMYMTWEKKKILDAKQAAKGRASVRKAEGGPAGGSVGAGGSGEQGGHAAPQGYWDGWKPTSASRGKVGDSQHYHTRDDSWKYNVSNTRGGAAAIQDRVEKSAWLWSAAGRSAAAQNRLVDAMQKHNNLQMNRLADKIEAYTELSKLGFAPGQQVAPPDTAAATPSGTPAATPSGTPAATPSGTPAATPSGTPAAMPAATPSGTPAATPAATPAVPDEWKKAVDDATYRTFWNGQ